MSRIIKFRIWDTNQKSWVNPYYTALKCNVAEGNQQILRSPALYNNFGDACGNYVVQQFTGLHDMNNAEIYEGDILGNPRYGHLEIAVHDHIMASEPGIGYQFGCDTANLIIVGNILENPEILKKDKK